MKKLILTLAIFFTFINVNAQTSEALKVNEKRVILIYGSPDCHHCSDTKKFLTDHKIDFIFYDIDHDKTAVQEMLSKLRSANISTKGLGIPVIDKYGEIFQNKGNFDDFLKKLIE